MYEIGPFSIILIIAGIVELIKKLGVQGNKLILISCAVGLVIGVIFKINEMYPAVQPYIEILIYGIAFGLSASGLYDITKKFTAKD